jgi:hypothetical protein
MVFRLFKFLLVTVILEWVIKVAPLKKIFDKSKVILAVAE